MIVVTGATGALNGATVGHLLDRLPPDQLVVVARDPSRAERFAELGVAVRYGESRRATVLEVRAQDRPGLLHELGAALAQAGISVRSAHIATYAGQTLDTFYLTGADGLQLPPARVAQAVSLVIDTCDGI